MNILYQLSRPLQPKPKIGQKNYLTTTVSFTQQVTRAQHAVRKNYQWYGEESVIIFTHYMMGFVYFKFETNQKVHVV